MADKLLFVTRYVCLAATQVLPAWLTLIVLLRDALIVSGVGLYRLLLGQLQLQPSRLGKLSTMMQIVLVLAVLLELSILLGFADVRWLLIYGVLLLALASAGRYVWVWVAKLNEQRRSA